MEKSRSCGIIFFKSLFLCVADMNGLKYINDTFGHEHGDKAIAELAGIISLSAFRIQRCMK